MRVNGKMADIPDEALLVDHPHARLSVRGMGDQHGCGTETKRHVSDVAAAYALDSSVEARPAKLTGLRRGYLKRALTFALASLNALAPTVPFRYASMVAVMVSLTSDQ